MKTDSESEGNHQFNTPIQCTVIFMAVQIDSFQMRICDIFAPNIRGAIQK